MLGTTTTTTTTKEIPFDSYLTLIPRGLEDTAQDLVTQQLTRNHYHMEWQLLGEPFVEDKSNYVKEQRYRLQKQYERNKQKHRDERNNGILLVESCCHERIGSLAWDQNYSNSHPFARQSISVGYGSSTSHTNQNKTQEGIGQEEILQDKWTVAGEVQGIVWVLLRTNAPIQFIQYELRCLGILLSLVQVTSLVVQNGKEEKEEVGNYSKNVKDGRSSSTDGIQLLGPEQSLPQAVTHFRHVLQQVYDHQQSSTTSSTSPSSSIHYSNTTTSDSNINLQTAMNIWYQYAMDESWGFNTEQRQQLIDKFVHKMIPIRYRWSCLRTDSKRYRYSRQDFLNEIVDDLMNLLITTTHNHTNINVSQSSSTQQQPCVDPSYNIPTEEENWVVDLINYDVELVLFLRPTIMAIGVCLRPYQHLHTTSFRHGTIPSDISPPIVIGHDSTLVRLRPSTAQLLLHLCNLQPGDIVLDPCVGTGTLAIEALFYNCYNSKFLGGGEEGKHNKQLPVLPISVMTLGGDLILSSTFISAQLSQYAQQARQYQRKLFSLIHSKQGLLFTSNSTADFVSWDAGYLPIRNAAVDVIVSDLPFGQQCSTAMQLSVFLPHLMAELARIVRPGTGRLVLLCGSYTPILHAMYMANVHSNSSHQPEDHPRSHRIWELPCTAVFPVNIGGHVAWVIQVRRGYGTFVQNVSEAESHRSVLRRMTQKRELVSRVETSTNKKGTKERRPRRVQS